MANAALINDAGLPLILPASSITAILSTVSAANKEHPDAGSVIFTTFRGSSVHFLGQSAKDVRAEVDAKSETYRRWLLLPIGDDCQALDPESVEMAEGVKVEGETYLRVHFARHDGAPMYADANFDEALVAAVSDLIVEKPTAPAPGAPSKARRG